MLLRVHTVAHPHGYVCREYADGRVQEFDLQVCCHCQYTWRVVSGSGRQRGYCKLCAGVVCGAAVCMTTCVHFERRIELIEAGARP